MKTYQKPEVEYVEFAAESVMNTGTQSGEDVLVPED